MTKSRFNRRMKCTDSTRATGTLTYESLKKLWGRIKEGKVDDVSLFYEDRRPVPGGVLKLVHLLVSDENVFHPGNDDDPVYIYQTKLDEKLQEGDNLLVDDTEGLKLALFLAKQIMVAVNGERIYEKNAKQDAMARLATLETEIKKSDSKSEDDYLQDAIKRSQAFRKKKGQTAVKALALFDAALEDWKKGKDLPKSFNAKDKYITKLREHINNVASSNTLLPNDDVLKNVINRFLDLFLNNDANVLDQITIPNNFNDFVMGENKKQNKSSDIDLHEFINELIDENSSNLNESSQLVIQGLEDRINSLMSAFDVDLTEQMLSDIKGYVDSYIKARDASEHADQKNMLGDTVKQYVIGQSKYADLYNAIKPDDMPIYNNIFFSGEKIQGKLKKEWLLEVYGESPANVGVFLERLAPKLADNKVDVDGKEEKIDYHDFAHHYIELMQHIVAAAQASDGGYDFDAAIDSWKQEYQDAYLNHKLLSSLAYTSEGIQPDLKSGNGYSRKWGGDDDLTLALGTFELDLESKEPLINKGVYILKPVPIIDGSISYALPDGQLLDLGKDPTSNLAKSALGRMYQQLEGASRLTSLMDEVTVILPVNKSKSHWQMVEATMKNGVITEVTLHDSIGKLDKRKMTESEQISYHELIQAVGFVNNIRAGDSKSYKGEKAKFNIERYNVQSNSWSCMDYTLQRALSIYDNKKAAKQPELTENLKKIKEAENPKALREAVIERLIERKPDLKMKKEKNKDKGKDKNKEQNKEKKKITSLVGKGKKIGGKAANGSKKFDRSGNNLHDANLVRIQEKLDNECGKGTWTVHKDEKKINEKKEPFVEVTKKDSDEMFEVHPANFQTGSEDVETFRAMIVAFKANNDGQNLLINTSDDLKPAWQEAFKLAYTAEERKSVSLRFDDGPALVHDHAARPKL